MCVCECEGMKEDRECTYSLLPVQTHGSASALLALELLSPMLADTRASAFLARGPSLPMLADATASAFLACGLLPAMGTSLLTIW